MPRARWHGACVATRWPPVREESPVAHQARHVWPLLALCLLGPGAARADVAGTDPEAPESPRCIACQADRAAVLGRYDAEELQALRSGEILTWTETPDFDADFGEGWMRAALVVERPPRDVWEVLTDYGSWPDFLAGLTDLSVLSVDSEVRLRHHIDLFGRKVEFGTVRSLEPRQGRIQVHLDPRQENGLERNQSRWLLVPLDDGGRTFVEFSFRIETGWWIPGFVERSLVRRALLDRLEVFRQEIRRRAEAGTGRGGA